MLSRLQRFSYVTGKRYRTIYAGWLDDSCGSKVPVPAECRELSLNLGGNTDDIFALSILLRVFLFGYGLYRGKESLKAVF